MKLVLTCNTGLESVCKEELIKLGCNKLSVYDGFIEFDGINEDIAKVNLWSRVGNKLYVNLGDFDNVTSFDDLFDSMGQINWSDYFDKGQFIHVDASVVKSELKSLPSIQAIGKKSIVKSLVGNRRWEEDKDNGSINIKLVLNKNKLSVLLNTTGDGLHKRGYKLFKHVSPIKENIASGLIGLAEWNPKIPLYDFFCGSGTILIEAFMMACRIAPGLFRGFDFMQFKWFEKTVYKSEYESAISRIKLKNVRLHGYDIESENVIGAKKNLAYILSKLNLNYDIDGIFQTKDFMEHDFDKLGEGIDKKNKKLAIINPPYGNRYKVENLNDLYHQFKHIYERVGFKGGVITDYNYFFRIIDDKKWKLRRLYNGGTQVHFYKIK